MTATGGAYPIGPYRPGDVLKGLQAHIVEGQTKLAGGVLLNSASYRERVLEALTSLGVQSHPVTLVHEPAEGAVRRAIKTLEKPHQLP